MSTTFKALRNGLRARTVVLPDEYPSEFEQLCDDLEAEWQPQSRTEQFYLEQMVVSQWKLTRMEIAEQSIFLQTEGPKVQIPLLDRLWRCQCRLERSYAQAQRELQKLQSTRREPAAAQQQPARRAAVLELQPQDQLQLPGGLVQRRD